MILGVYADLHSNLEALQSMEQTIGAVDRWVSLGDSVGLYPGVNEVLDWQREHDVLYVSGDHEDALLGDGELPSSFTGTVSIQSQQRTISADNRGLLETLPEVVELNADGRALRFSHYLTDAARRPEAKYSFDIASLDQEYTGYDYVFYAHTHLPAINIGRNAVFINPGSAGFPVDVERRCSAVVFDTTDASYDVIRFDYDTDALIEAIETAGYSPSLTAFIRNGHRWQ